MCFYLTLFPVISVHTIFTQKVDQYTFEGLHNIMAWWEEAENNVKLNEVTRLPQVRRDHLYRAMNQELATKEDLTSECRNELLKMYNILFRLLLSRKLPFSSHEIDDFEQVKLDKISTF